MRVQLQLSWPSPAAPRRTFVGRAASLQTAPALLERCVALQLLHVGGGPHVAADLHALVVLIGFISISIITAIGIAIATVGRNAATAAAIASRAAPHATRPSPPR